MYVCTQVIRSVGRYANTYIHTQRHAFIHTYTFVCVYIYTLVCVYIYICEREPFRVYSPALLHYSEHIDYIY